MANELSAADLIQRVTKPRGYEIQHTQKMEDVAPRRWLPRLQCMTPSSEAVKAGTIPRGFYLIHTKTKMEPLGESVNVYPITFRRKALDTSDRGSPIAVYELGEAFDDIKERSTVRDSGCMWGPEFLIWVPSATLGATKFCTFFMCSVSARNEAPNFDPILQEQGFATLGMQLLKNTKYSWWNPEIRPYSGELVLPTEEQLRTVLHDFNSPPKGATVERDADTESSDRDR